MTSERNVDIAVERRGECMLIMLEQAVSPVLFHFWVISATDIKQIIIEHSFEYRNIWHYYESYSSHSVNLYWIPLINNDYDKSSW